MNGNCYEIELSLIKFISVSPARAIKTYVYRRRVALAALREALSVTFGVTRVQTVLWRTLTLSYALFRPPERQRRPTRPPGRPGRFSCRPSGDPGVGKGAQDGQEKRPELRGELHLAVFPRLQRPALAAVSCTAIKTRYDASMSESAVQIPRRHASICAHPRLERAAPRLLGISV